MKRALNTLCVLVTLGFLSHVYAFSRGIYITQSTAQHKTRMTYLIAQAKKYGIDTFIVDVNGENKAYRL
jgi:hypothetical protein